MRTKDFSEEQKQALTDLLIVGMYADHKLSLSEDAAVNHLLDTFAFASPYARQQFYDAAIARANRHTDSPETIRHYIVHLSGQFSSLKDREDAYYTLTDLLKSDGRVVPEENQLLAIVRQAFQL